MRKLIATVALVTAVAVAGLAVAAVNPLQLVSAKSAKSSSPTSSQADPGSTGTPLAARPGRGAKLIKQALDGLVKKGTITAAQEEAIEKAIQAQVQNVRKPGARKGLRRGVVVVSAKTIGISPQDLVKELRSGKSIAQVAQAKNVDPQKVIDAIVTAGSAKADAALKAGKIDAAKAAKIKQRLPDLAQKIVNRVPKHRAGN